ncbi:MAG: DUF5615 family PIN-like protein [Pyrinomonadaceae bacterium]
MFSPKLVTTWPQLRASKCRATPDKDVIQVCLAESRCLVTLDLDFSNPLRFRPAEYSGIAVIRVPAAQTIRKCLLLLALSREPWRAK